MFGWGTGNAPTQAPSIELILHCQCSALPLPLSASCQHGQPMVGLPKGPGSLTSTLIPLATTQPWGAMYLRGQLMSSALPWRSRNGYDEHLASPYYLAQSEQESSGIAGSPQFCAAPWQNPLPQAQLWRTRPSHKLILRDYESLCRYCQGRRPDTDSKDDWVCSSPDSVNVLPYMANGAW